MIVKFEILDIGFKANMMYKSAINYKWQSISFYSNIKTKIIDQLIGSGIVIYQKSFRHTKTRHL